ncbi:MAG: transposase [Phycisphaerales bacterium]
MESPGHRRPLGYLITFHTYGTWLHGDVRGSVDRGHRAPNTPPLPRSDSRRAAEGVRLKSEPVVLSIVERGAADRCVREVCEHRGWTLHAVNVRTNHVHVVVSAETTPERVMNGLKSWMTRRIREVNGARAETTLWTRHGSTRHLWDSRDLNGAIEYVRDRQ